MADRLIDSARSTVGRARTAASNVFHRSADKYTLRLGGRRITFSTTDPVAHQWFYPRYAFNRLHERSVTLRLVQDFARARCFADIGANLGFYTCLAQKLMPGGAVHSFEMDQHNYGLLTANVALNQSGVDVITTKAAVSDHVGTIDYQIGAAGINPALGQYAAVEGAVRTVTVPTVVLKSYFAALGTAPDLMKVDVEGAELDVLRGMGDLLAEVHTLYVELHPDNLAVAGQEPGEVLELLAANHRIFVQPDIRARHERLWREVTPDSPMTGNPMLLATHRSFSR